MESVGEHYMERTTFDQTRWRMGLGDPHAETGIRQPAARFRDDRLGVEDDP
jgi:hypothetical protein